MREPTADNSSFSATRWTMVRRAQGSSEQSRQALADLCQTYWQPVFRFLRCDGRSADEARELTQEFFAGVLQRGRVGAPSPAQGKFRSYLLGAVKHFLADRRKAVRRQKRGGGIAHVPLDTQSHSGPGLQIPDPATAFDETYFDQQWALALIERVLARLEDEFQRGGKPEQFALLKPYLTGAGSTAAKQASAAASNLSPGALKVAAHRLRKRYRALVLEEIADTVAEPGEVEGELHYLLAVLSKQA